jgi:hypothetical protein
MAIEMKNDMGKPGKPGNPGHIVSYPLVVNQMGFGTSKE